MKTTNQRVNNFDIRVIFTLEQKSYPFYNVIEIDIVEIKNGKIQYKTLFCSKYDNKWKKWSNTKEIEINKLVTEIREEKINSILLS